MKKILLNIAHFILKKYGVIPLDIKDKVLYNGTIFEIQSYTLSKEFFKTDLEMRMSDCFKWVDKKIGE